MLDFIAFVALSAFFGNMQITRSCACWSHLAIAAFTYNVPLPTIVRIFPSRPDVILYDALVIADFFDLVPRSGVGCVEGRQLITSLNRCWECAARAHTAPNARAHPSPNTRARPCAIMPFHNRACTHLDVSVVHFISTQAVDKSRLRPTL